MEDFVIHILQLFHLIIEVVQDSIQTNPLSLFSIISLIRIKNSPVYINLN